MTTAQQPTLPLGAGVRRYLTPSFLALLNSTDVGYMDVIGQVYTRYVRPQGDQVLTPWDVAEEVAQAGNNAGDLEGVWRQPLPGRRRPRL